MKTKSGVDTVIFDMDGLLIDSEPLWEIAGREWLHQFGHQLTHELYEKTTGLRTREWIEYWANFFQLKEVNIEQGEKQIIRRVLSLVDAEGKMLPGVHYILDFFQTRQFNIALATSSPLELARLVMDKLDIRHYFKTVTSAQQLPFGKPHPQVYLNCAASMNVHPMHCVCFEDSFNGMIAAKAAKMKCVVVPAASQAKDLKWGAADQKISSLLNFNDLLLLRL